MSMGPVDVTDVEHLAALHGSRLSEWSRRTGLRTAKPRKQNIVIQNQDTDRRLS